MILLALLLFVTLSALLPAGLFAKNLGLFRKPTRAPSEAAATRNGRSGEASEPPISVLIPARNEAATIERTLHSLLRAADKAAPREIQILVMDDSSEDDTARLVETLAKNEPRVELRSAPPLPSGWCGKQHACAKLAEAAHHPLLLFLDADVRLSPSSILDLTTFYEESGSELVSGFPHQETGGLLEKLLLPQMHFILLGFLPLKRMRTSTHPAYAAGCGQLFLTHRDDYRRAGGHAAIKASLHDGVQLPRAYRKKGLKTDICDATDLATCRMYTRPKDVWEGLTKNAREGLGSPRTILFFTAVLGLGQVLPFALLFLLLAESLLAGGGGNSTALGLSPTGLTWFLVVTATILSISPRLAAAFRFRQPLLGALLHPVGIAILLAIQWTGFLRPWLRRSKTWKGREY